MSRYLCEHYHWKIVSNAMDNVWWTEYCQPNRKSNFNTLNTQRRNYSIKNLYTIKILENKTDIGSIFCFYGLNVWENCICPHIWTVMLSMQLLQFGQNLVLGSDIYNLCFSSVKYKLYYTKN